MPSSRPTTGIWRIDNARRLHDFIETDGRTMPEPTAMERFTIVPIEGDSYEGRQWGYHVLVDGLPYLRATTGGTGSCWNFSRYEVNASDGEWVRQDEGDWHICELDDLIGALEALKASPAHRENVQRWQ
jgi:hypothetical protein